MPRIALPKDQPFSLDLTLGCGQAFRWEKDTGGWWLGVADGKVIRCRQNGRTLSYEGADRDYIRHYFSLDTDLTGILEAIDRDEFIHAAIERSAGLRLVRQPPWECLCSYVCATNTNIPAIKRRIAFLSEQFGDKVLGNGMSGHTFPGPEKIACHATADCLSSCRLGYRAPYVFGTSRAAAAEAGWAKKIAQLPYGEAHKEMTKFSGVGPKAADCVLLFAFQKYEAFPVDVWIRRIMREHYLPELSEGSALTGREYDTIRRFARKHFGEYCGYAQEYLYAGREG